MANRTEYKVDTTRKPSGMVVDRNDMNFSVRWKVMDTDHGAGQNCSWHTNVSGDKWFPAVVTSSDTMVDISPVASNYYPYTDKVLKWLSCIVQGKRSQTTETTTSGSDTVTTITNYRWSEWGSVVYRISPPNAPTLEQDLDTEAYPKCTFSWEVDTSPDDNKPFTRVEWQSLRVRESSVIDGSKLRWAASSTNDFQSGVGAATGGVPITEDSSDLADTSWTRWVRVRSLGPGGASAWRYIKHVYAKPYAPTIERAMNRTTMQYAQTYAQTTRNAINIRVQWTSYWVSAHPIDHLLVQYLIDTPAEGMATPAEPNWQTAMKIYDSRESDVAEFSVDGRVDTDKCLWVRVVAVHDVYQTSSAVYRLAVGELAAPAFNGTISLDYTEKKATISVVHNSKVTDSRIAVYFHKNEDTPFICSIIERGQDPKVIPLNWFETTDSLGFSLMEFQGTASRQTRTYTVSGTTYTYNRYTLDTNMVSDKVDNGGDVPVSPTGFRAIYKVGIAKDSSNSSKSEKTVDVLVDWNWNWYNATHAEISWSTNPNAWESTDPPSNYSVDRMRPSQLWVTGLNRGLRWYFRARFIRVYDDVTVYGPYTATKSVLLADTPPAPSITAPNPAITVENPAALSGVSYRVGRTGLIRVGWVYSNTDGTEQKSAVVREVTSAGAFVRTVARIDGQSQYAEFQPSTFPWAAGTTHYLQVRVTSSAGLTSEWSESVAVEVAPPVTCQIASSSLVTETVNGVDRLRLKELPLTVTITGAGDGDTTSLVVERAYDYTIVRPDETEFHGCAGETIASLSHLGAGGFSVSLDDLYGSFDDYAWYRIIATVQDSFGQYKTVRQTFQVRWTHQPVRPTGTVVMDGNQAIITPALPAGMIPADGDVVDIYRMSADKPEAVILGGEWGKSYRDPYPAIGELGGHRIVYRSANGDYFDANSVVAWTTLRRAAGDYLDSRRAIIDFDRYQIELDYNVDVSSNWTKDFTETAFLGGAVQGDWNPAVQRKTTVNTMVISKFDIETQRNLRRLAVYPGICHVRTPDGSSYSADIQVQESRSHTRGGAVLEYTLAITRVDPEALDGVEEE